MSERKNNQLDFADHVVVHNPNLNKKLEDISKKVNWKPFERLLSSIFSAQTGRPGYSSLMLFKSLLLQGWYNLSDYALEEAIDDRLSFRRFIGLSASEKPCDHSTISRFRARLIQMGLEKKLFEELHKQLEEKSILVKKGTLVDATFIEADVAKPNQKEDGRGGRSDKDRDARWCVHNKKKIFGYKGHVGVDMGSGIIRKAILTAANIHETKLFPNMVSKDEKWVMADCAYESIQNNQFLRENKICSGLMFKPKRNNPLRPIEKFFNKAISKHRAAVERIFGTLKRSYGYRRVRYRSLSKNNLQFILLCMAYNMKKMVRLCS